MAEKILNSRIVQKHDVEENWLSLTNFIPKQGEIIIYDIDDSYEYERIKVGDGTTNVNELQFVDDAVKDLLIDYVNVSMKDTVTVDGGGYISLEDIFGEPPYTIEITDELEELQNVTVASGSDYSTYRLRNVAIVTEIPTQMNDGDIALVINKGG